MSSLASRRSNVLPDVSLHPLALLDRILRDLELSPTQLVEARTSYEAVTEALAKAGMPVAPFLPSLFAQGSMRIGTTVKPVGQEEHDLDIVCLLQKGGIWLPANEVYELVWETLGNDATYEQMRERRNRCIRLRYAHKYYLDIIPAVPHSSASDGALFVCDCKGRTWSVSNPVGFAEWFDDRTKAQPLFITNFGALREGSVAANATQVEPLPEHGFQKTPLQRITQLFKRNRDEFFLDDPMRRPSSILLTTLAARSYVRETTVAADDLFEFVIRVADGLGRFIEIEETALGPRIYRVRNPVNDAENFAEKWTALDYDAFTRWQQKLVHQLRAVKAAKGQGIDTMLNRLVEGFGQDRVIKAANELGVDTSQVHQAKRLRVAGTTGAVGLMGSTMAATTYHGQ
ncbi:MAG TPA: nucleotidyltransferase [Chthoniobacterales bacterium]|nr:nucleotidyltransferase [Chthoniobacterales bacterium]